MGGARLNLERAAAVIGQEQGAGYRFAREAFNGFIQRLWPKDELARIENPEEILGIAHAMDDCRCYFLGIYNRRVHADEEREWERFMAL